MRQQRRQLTALDRAASRRSRLLRSGAGWRSGVILPIAAVRAEQTRRGCSPRYDARTLTIRCGIFFAFLEDGSLPARPSDQLAQLQGDRQRAVPR
jgi:hypothetical protein